MTECEKRRMFRELQETPPHPGIHGRQAWERETQRQSEVGCGERASCRKRAEKTHADRRFPCGRAIAERSPKYDASAAANWIARSIPPRAQVSGMDWASYIVLRRRGGCKQERQQHRPHSEYDPEGGGVAGGSKNQTDPGEG